MAFKDLVLASRTVSGVADVNYCVRRRRGMQHGGSLMLTFSPAVASAAKLQKLVGNRQPARLKVDLEAREFLAIPSMKGERGFVLNDNKGVRWHMSLPYGGPLELLFPYSPTTVALELLEAKPDGITFKCPAQKES